MLGSLPCPEVVQDTPAINTITYKAPGRRDHNIHKQSIGMLMYVSLYLHEMIKV